MAGKTTVDQVQLGNSGTASQNFVLQTNNDGSGKLSRGNAGATTQDLITWDANGVVLLPATQSTYNRVINAGCQIAQRGAVTLSGAGAVTYGGCDRFLTQAQATTVSGSIQQGTPSSSGYGQSGSVHQIVALSTTGTTTVGFFQRLEAKDVVDMNGKTVTFSGMLFQTSGSTVTFTPQISKANSVDNFGGVTTLATGAGVSVPPNTPTRFTVSVALGATDASNGIQLGINASVAAQSSTQWHTADWFFDIGTVVPAIVPKVDYQQELARCQRYLPAFAYAGATEDIASGLGTGASNGIAFIPFKVQARAAPTGITVGTVGSFSGSTATALAALNTLTFGNGGAWGARLSFSQAGATWASGQPMVLIAAASGATILFNGCEL